MRRWNSGAHGVQADGIAVTGKFYQQVLHSRVVVDEQH
jgi:hypothetical protein